VALPLVLPVAVAEVVAPTREFVGLEAALAVSDVVSAGSLVVVGCALALLRTERILGQLAMYGCVLS